MKAARWLTASCLALIALTAVLVAQRDQGVVRDEVVYMTYGSRYASWWSDLVSGKSGTLTKATITSHFGGAGATANNREHPPLMKTAMGLSERLFHQRLGWTSQLTAYRIPSAAMNALLVALIFAFTAGRWGHAAGLVAALATLLLPRAFFHAGLGAFDAAMVTLWMATIMAYDRALSSRRWCLGLGVIFGLALATKHNALMLPGVLMTHYLWVAFRSQRDTVSGAGIRARILAALRATWRGVFSTQPLIIPALALIGPLVLIALWPWLWFDTIQHIADWVRFHLQHVHYNYEYLGRNWNAPPFPWHVPVVTTLLTVPVATLVAAACGGAALWRQARRHASVQPDRAPALLLVLSALVAMGPFLTGRAPIFGAEKHWAPAIPTLCIFAGIGVTAVSRLAAQGLVSARLIAATRATLAAGVTTVVIGALVVAAGAAETLASRPYALSHYNALAGGAPGGADLGMNRQFWGYAARGVLPYLARRAPAPDQRPMPVYTHDASPAWGTYREAGLLAPTLADAGHEGAGIARSRLALVVHERHFNRHDYLIWNAYGTVQPVFVLTFQGVPIVSVYERPR